MNVGFIGNFIPPFSTENDRKWSLLMLGHDVTTFQENETSPFTLIRFAEEKRLDVLLYSHTHDPAYVIKDLKKVFKLYEEKGIPTASVHLDRWAGLAREKDIGKEATWFTKYQFMADGSPEAKALYEKHKLNWFWAPPAVVARDCYLAPPDPVRFPHEIVFIGSKNYHPEYPFRGELVEWLHKTYGSRFGLYGNEGHRVVRGHDLNVLCASAKIIVGDSCFGGRPYYWSDRVPEIIGRGGFLIHPILEGETIGHSGYKNLTDLKEKIDYWLDPENEKRRLKNQYDSYMYVRHNETYTHRMNGILQIIWDQER